MAATEQDVELAILSLDSYNRGYLPGMTLTDAQRAVTIGGATIDATSTDELGSGVDSAASFYAVAYNWQGNTVIAYRGTRFDGANFTLPDAGDVMNGWTLSVGYAQAAQAQLAMQFYTDVTGAQVAFGQAPGNVILTGHSLGGGLAGFVADLTGLPADVFNNIPFGSATVAETMTTDASFFTSGLWNLVTGNLFTGGNLVGLPTASSNVQQFDTAGEVAGDLRATGDALSAPVIATQLTPAIAPTTLSGVAVEAAADAIAGAAAAYGLWLDQSTTSETLNANAGTAASASCLHSMGLNALLTYADWKQYSGWKTIGAQLYNAEFSDSLAEQIGIPDSSKDGWYAASGKLIAAIAYSAAPGSSPFGQLAAQSYFADADTLAGLIKSASPSSILTLAGVQQDLADILVQFAGDQAWSAGALGGSDAVGSGIGDFTQNAGGLTVDLSPAKWSSTRQNGGQIVGALRLINDAVNPLLAPIWANVVPPSEFSTAINSIANALTEIVIGTNAGATIDVSNTLDAIVAAADGDSVRGGSCNALIVGGASVDTGCGNDVVVAQTDDERIALGSGTDFVVGNYDPSGQLGDTVVLSGSRNAYEITPDAVGGNTVDIAGVTAGSATDYVVANVGQFQFSDQMLSYSALLAIKNVQFASGGYEAAASDSSPTPTLIGSIVGVVGNPDDTLTYALDPNDPSSQDFALSSDGVLSLNAGVQVDEATWLSKVEALLAAGWNWVASAPGEMVSNGSAQAAEVSPQQLLIGTPFEATVEVTDQTTGARTEQTLVIPCLGDDSGGGSLAVQVKATPQGASLTTLSDDSDGIELATLSATGAFGAIATYQIGSGNAAVDAQNGFNDALFSIENGDQLWLNAGYSLSALNLGNLAALITGATPVDCATAVFVQPIYLPLSLSLSCDTSNGAMVTSDAVLKGTGEAGATVTFTDNGAALAGSTTIASDGSFFFNPTGLSDGVQDVVAYENDGVRSQTQTLNFALDTTAPNIAINGSGAYTSSTDQTISGTVSDVNSGSTVSIFDNSAPNPIAIANVAADGTWSADLTLAQGANKLTVSAKDAAGNTGYSDIDEIDVGGAAWNGGSAPTIDEFPAAGSVVGTVAPSFGKSATWTYSLTNSCNGAFAIDPDTGVVTVANGGGLDFDSTPSINLGVQIVDSSGKTFDASLAVNLSNHHTPPTAFAYTTPTLAQFPSAGAPAVHLTGVTDVDQTDGFRLVLVNDPTGGDFKVSDDGQSIVTTGAGALPTGQTNLLVNVIDGDGYRMATPQTVAIIVQPSTRQIQDAAFATAMMQAGAVNATPSLTTLESEFASLGVTITAMPGGTDKMTFAPGKVTISSSADDLFQTDPAGGPLYGTSIVDYMAGIPNAATTFYGSALADIILGHAQDTVSYAASTTGVTIDLSQKIAGTNADKAQVGGDAAGDILIGIENVMGSGAAQAVNSFKGDNNANVFTGDSPYANTFIYSPGGDTYIGGVGANVDNVVDTSASSANANINLLTGLMTVGNDAPTTLRNINTVTGTKGVDTITLGNSNGEDVSANTAGDTFIGENGSADIWASGLDDLFEPAAGAETIFCGKTETLSYANSPSGVTLRYDSYLGGLRGTGGYAQGDAIVDPGQSYINWTIAGSAYADFVSVMGLGTYTFSGGGGVDSFSSTNFGGNSTVTIDSGNAFGGYGCDIFTATGTGTADFDPGIDPYADVMNFGASYGILDYTHDSGSVHLDFQNGVFEGYNPNAFGSSWFNLDTTFAGNIDVVTVASPTAYVAAGAGMQAILGGETLIANDTGMTLESPGTPFQYQPQPTLIGGLGNDILEGGQCGGTTFDGGGGVNEMYSRTLWGDNFGGADKFVFDTAFVEDDIYNFGGWSGGVLDFKGQSLGSLNVYALGGNAVIDSSLGRVVLEGHADMVPSLQKGTYMSFA